VPWKHGPRVLERRARNDDTDVVDKDEKNKEEVGGSNG
jgi:hypothetical protein